MNCSRSRARVFVVDDHPSIRHGLTLVLERAGFVVCAEEDSVAKAVARLPELTMDLAVVDLSYDEGDGFDLIIALCAHQTPVLVYSMHEDADNIEHSFHAGAMGYVSKREDSRILLEGVRAALLGDRYTSPRATQALADRERSPLQASRFSARELQILYMLGRGQGNSEIAEALSISVRTVETYCKRLHQKLNLVGMKELRQFAIRHHAG